MHFHQHTIRSIQRSVLVVAGCTGSCLADIDFHDAVKTQAAGEVTQIAAGNLEGGTDGIDIVALIPVGPNGGGAIQALRNDGGPDLTALRPVRLGPGEPTALAVGLINGDDQFLDVAVAMADKDMSGNFVIIMLGKGNGTFNRSPDITLNNRPSSVKLSTFGGEPFLDLAVAFEDPNRVDVFFGDGKGGFDAAAAAKAPRPIRIEPECLKDGFGQGEDIAGVGQNGLGPGSGSVFVLFNDDAGGFEEVLTFDIGVGPTDLSIGDLNVDGFLDIVASNGGEGSFSYLLNEDGEDFSAHQIVKAGGSPVSIVAVDLVNDGDADVAVVADDLGGNPTVRVLENIFDLEDVFFAGAVEFSVGATPNTIISADINGDGLQDLLTGNFDAGPTGGSISVLINNPFCEDCGDLNCTDCFVAGTAGGFCNDHCGGPPCVGCCRIVCSVDPQCCDVEWDEVCAATATDLCGNCIWDLDDSNSVGVTDLALLLGSWGDPYGTAHLIALLGDWGPCQFPPPPPHDHVYINGAGPNYDNGNEMAQWAQAEDFTGVDGVIVDVHYSVLDTALTGLAQWDGTIQYAIYEGDPNANAVIGSGNAQHITIAFDQSANGFDFYDISFGLEAGVAVEAANTYWLALHMGQSFDANSLFWATQDANGTATGLESDGGFDGPWDTNGLEHWFQLGGVEDPP